MWNWKHVHAHLRTCWPWNPVRGNSQVLKNSMARVWTCELHWHSNTVKFESKIPPPPNLQVCIFQYWNSAINKNGQCERACVSSLELEPVIIYIIRLTNMGRHERQKKTKTNMNDRQYESSTINTPNMTIHTKNLWAQWEVWPTSFT